METSVEIDKLAAAMAKAKGTMQPALKSAINPAFARGGSKGSSYAKLEDCDKAATPALTQNELVLLQGVHGTDFVARLLHSSGQWIQIRVPLPGDVHQMTIQQLGSMTTYLRRQTYSLVGLVTDDDDDGNAASANGKGDRSGRPDTSGVDLDVADEYANAMIRAMDSTDATQAQALHKELCADPAMYTAAMDEFKKICKTNSITYPRDKWDALVKQKAAA